MSRNASKLLVICGPTGVGKTGLGVLLARQFNGEIVSADSRQIYKGLDIATGKDLKGGLKVKDWWELEGVPVHLVDIAEPDESFTVANYYVRATEVLNDIKKAGKLPIVVGGTGLYIKALTDGISTLGVAPNRALREQYKTKSSEELLMILARLSPELANSLNKSEQYNKQRLIRRVEIAQLGNIAQKEKRKKSNYDSLFIGLTAPGSVLRGRINKRIDAWVKEGAEKEVRTLLEEGIGWEAQSMSALGYKQWRSYIEKRATREQAIEKWKTEEYRYAKRQLTWFKKDPRVIWFDITEPDWRGKVENRLRSWYHI